jgi:hypothetical protein
MGGLANFQRYQASFKVAVKSPRMRPLKVGRRCRTSWFGDPERSLTSWPTLAKFLILSVSTLNSDPRQVAHRALVTEFCRLMCFWLRDVRAGTRLTRLGRWADRFPFFNVATDKSHFRPGDCSAAFNFLFGCTSREWFTFRPVLWYFPKLLLVRDALESRPRSTNLGTSV